MTSHADWAQDPGYLSHVETVAKQVLRRNRLPPGQQHDDALNETMSRVSRRSANVAMSDAFVAGVARKVVKSMWRKARAKRRDFRRACELDEAATGDLTGQPLADLAHREDHEARRVALMAAIARLSPRQREVVRLCDFDALSYSQIAERLGVNVDCVRQHHCLALRNLRIFLLAG